MVPYIFLIAPFLFIAIFIAYPLGYSLFLSFSQYDYIYDAVPKFIGLAQYIDLFRLDERFLVALRNTLVFGGVYFSLVMILSLIIAFLVNEVIKGKFFFQLSIYLPIIVPLSLAAVVFVWILDPTFGIFNFLLRKMGFSRLGATNWLGNYDTSLYTLVVIKLWKFTGFTVLIFLAGLQSIPSTLSDAATIDGASFLQEKVYVILPNLKEYLFIASLYSIIQAVKVFELPYIATGGGPGNATLTLYLYTWRTAFGYFKMGKASAIAYVTAGLIILCTMVAFWTLGKRER